MIPAAVALLALVVAPVDTSAARAKPKPVLRQVVDSLVHDGAPGAIAVVRTPASMHRAASGLADRTAKVRMQANDRFRIASLTKAFVATVVLELVGEGKLSLDDTVDHWLPGTVTGGREITVRELLNHSSGLYNYTDAPEFQQALITNPSRVWAPTELVAIANSHGQMYEPGTTFSYANTNYVVLGLIVQAVTGRPLEQELSERLFAPLGLAATSFPATTAIDSPYAHGYAGTSSVPQLKPGTLIDVTPLLSPTWLWAAGAIVSTGDDVTRFYAALFGGKLLPPNLLLAMRTTFAPGTTQGFGIKRIATRCGVAYGHEGDYTGWRTEALARANGRREAVVTVNIDDTEVPWGELKVAAERAFCAG